MIYTLKFTNMKDKEKIQRFPKEIIERMLDEQEALGNKRNIEVFYYSFYSAKFDGGFNWAETKDGVDFWDEVISEENFELFFEKYPKQKESYGSADSPFEAIKIINHYGLNFNLGNVIKYVLRDKDNRLQDLKKASDYINYEINRLENA